MLPLAIVLAVATQTPAPSPSEPGFWDDGQPGSYLQWYGAEYIVLLGAGALVAAGALHDVEPLPALIGPSLSLKSPGLTLIFDPRLDDVIGKPILKEQVPAGAVAAGAGAAILAVAGLDFAVRQDLHRTHAIVLGGVEAVLGAAMITEAMKLTFGRLRPDFRERWLRAACDGVTLAPADLDCTGVGADGFVVDHEFLLDGMKSFPSGHASMGFAAATFLALEIGGEYLWAERAPEWARPVAG